MLWIRDHLNYEGGDCLTWPFSRNPTGYGSFKRDGKTCYAHRYICEWAHGAPPDPSYQAAHSCGNGHLGCVNPMHLSWKTRSENQLESTWHPRIKLTAAKAAEIRRLKGIEYPSITAATYCVTEATVRKIQSGEIWSTKQPWLTPDEVIAIRTEPRTKGWTARLAAKYGVTRNSILRVHNGKSYSHIS